MEKPNKKVGAGALAGALSGILVWAMGGLGGIEIPPEIAVAFTVVIMFAVSYWVTE